MVMNVYNNYQEYKTSNAQFGIIHSTTKCSNLDTTWNELHLNNLHFIYYKHPSPQDTTFIVQGLPKEETFLRLILTLLQYGEVIISTWDTLDLESTLKFIKENNIENGQNIYLQIFTTLAGLNKCKTKYAVKVRADEWYKDFSIFLSKMKSKPDKITTHNMFFRTLGQYPYHISDHVIGGLTENLLKMFNSAKYMLETKIPLPHIPRILSHIPEQWLTVAYIRCFYNDDEILRNIRDKMIKHFQIVHMGAFKDFILRYTWHNQRHVINGVQELKDHSHAFAITDVIKIAPPDTM